MTDTPTTDNHDAAVDELDSIATGEADSTVDGRPAGERIDSSVTSALRAAHDGAKQLLAAKRAERDALNAEIRTLVDAEDRARRALHVYLKAAAK